jgi:beta-lactamase regulating signal transducer with metallopeptidase domain
MTLESLNQFLSTVPASAGQSAVRSIALALAVGFVLSVARIKDARLRLLTWTGVLYTSMMMPLLGFVLPAIVVRVLPPVTAPVAPSPSAAQVDTCIAFAGAAPGTGFPSAGAGRFAGDTPPASSKTEISNLTSALSAPRPGANTILISESPDTAIAPHNRASIAAIARRFGWGLAIMVYMLVAAILLARVITGLVLGARLRRQALEIAHPHVKRLLDLLLDRLPEQLPSAPMRAAPTTVAESSSISVPLATGVLNPVILLPPGWRDWDSQKLRAVLAHELSHVTRRDALTQLVSAVHRSIFWFSPLSWWLHRRLIDLAEQVSDDSALLAVKDPSLYAEVLLGFFQSLNALPARWLGVSMARGASAGRRIDRMLTGALPSPQRFTRRAIALIVVFGVVLTTPIASLRIGRTNSADHARTKVARSESTGQASTPATSYSVTIQDESDPSRILQQFNARLVRTWELSFPTSEADGQQGTPPAPPAVTQAPASPSASSSQSSTAVVAPAAPVMATAPVAPAVVNAGPVAAYTPLARLAGIAPAAPQAKEAGRVDRWESFAIVRGNGSTRITGMASGDDDRFRALRAKITGDFIWFKHEGRAYVVTDPEIVKAAEELFAPEEDLSRQEAELSKQLAALSQKQAELSRQISAVRVDLPDLTADLSKLMERMKGAKTEHEISELSTELARVQTKLTAAEMEANIKQSMFGRMQSELGLEQSKLGRQQSVLGQQQSRLARGADRQVRHLLERALSDGLAKPEP